MYNRILNRPMFKLGGDTVTAQGTGITSGLDAPRQGYHEKGLVELQEDVTAQVEGLGVTPEQRRSNALSAITSGFLNPEARTMGEALYHTNLARESGIQPLEARVAEQKFELSKIPLETKSGMMVQRAGIPETAIKTRVKILSAAMKIKNDWESDPANEGKNFIKDYPGYRDWEWQIIQATEGKITTLNEARQTAFDILMQDKIFASQWKLREHLSEEERKALDAQIQRMVDFFMGLPLGKASGGRIGYQEGIGPNVMEEQMTDTFQMPGETVQATEQVDEVLPTNGSMGQIPMPGQDPYMLLRARLPQEITDDVVRLIAYNPEAFADFAAIESQEDVVLFNQKYGVELVLPTEQA